MPDIEKAISETLDELCPPLSKTPLLQEKCLRVVFSVGIDTVMIDCMTLAYIGKLNIKSKDLLSSGQTEKVFGNFMVDTKQLVPREEQADVG
jgi:hypothetical protein